MARPVFRRLRLGFVAFCACLFGWALIQPLIGEKPDVGFMLLAGALLLNSSTDLVGNVKVRFSMVAASMILVIGFFVQR